MKLVLHRLAEKELTEAFWYYEDTSDGLGTEFLDQFQRSSRKLLAFPESAAVIRRIGNVVALRILNPGDPVRGQIFLTTGKPRCSQGGQGAWSMGGKGRPENPSSKSSMVKGLSPAGLPLGAEQDPVEQPRSWPPISEKSATVTPGRRG